MNRPLDVIPNAGPKGSRRDLPRLCEIPSLAFARDGPWPLASSLLTCCALQLRPTWLSWRKAHINRPLAALLGPCSVGTWNSGSGCGRLAAGSGSRIGTGDREHDDPDPAHRHPNSDSRRRRCPCPCRRRCRWLLPLSLTLSLSRLIPPYGPLPRGSAAPETHTATVSDRTGLELAPERE